MQTGDGEEKASKPVVSLDAQHKCSACGEEFLSGVALHKHVETSHNTSKALLKEDENSNMGVLQHSFFL